MITPYQLLQESGFAQYTAMVRFHYNRDNTSLGAEKIAEMVRAIPGATRVSTVSLDKEHGIGIFNVKIISMKSPKEAYAALKKNALERYQGLITGVEVGANTIEVKGDFIIKEGKKPNTNLSKVIGQLLEEGLLLEVSIEELRRQYVECDPPKITPEVFEQIVQASDNKSNYATWLCKKVVDQLVPLEDLEGWHDAFQFFDRYKQRFQKKDLNQIKTAEDINAFKEDFKKVKQEVEDKKTGIKSNSQEKEEMPPYQVGNLTTSDGREWKVYKTKKGEYDIERKVGSGAKWCTVASLNMFNYYLTGPDDHYYIFVNRQHPDTCKYQIHHNSNQFADINNDTPRDLGQPFIIEFYEYLKEKEGRDLPERIERAKREYTETLNTWEKIKNNEPVLGSKIQIKQLPTGASYFVLPKNLEECALAIRDAGFTKGAACVSLAKSFTNGGRADYYILNPKSGNKDILSIYENHYNFEGQLRSYLNSEYGNANLPNCDENNVEDYKAFAEENHYSIEPKVLLRCNKDLPSLESYKWRESDTRKGYKVPVADIREGKFNRAALQLGRAVPGPNLVPFVREVPAGANILICQSEDFVHIVAVQEGTNKILMLYSEDCANSAQSLDKMIKVVRFLNVKVEDLEYDENGGFLRKWLEIGRWQGILKELKATIDCPGVDSEKLKVAKLDKTAILVHGNATAKKDAWAVYRPNDISTLFVILNDGRTYRWSPANSPVRIDGSCTRQGDFRLGTIKPKDLVTVYEGLKIQMPGPLEKLSGRIRPGERPNVLQALRTNEDNLQLRTINLHNYTRGWQQGRTYSISGRGIYGTWEQLGPAIQRSSPQYYQRIQQDLANYPGRRVDVFLFYHDNNPRHTWNGVVRAINQETNRVEWYARRYGYDMGTQWVFRALEPEEQAPAGEQGEGNYVAPQPRPVRQPRQARNAQAAAQPAAPAPEINQEMREQLAQLRRQSHNSPEVYVIPANRTQEILPALGFTNLNPGQDRNVVVYRAYEHRGQTTHVALVYGNGQTIVAGYPQNPTVATAAADSQQWRRLVRQLDNSVRTFQQCHDICQELHIPLPVAIQGWLVYRGQR